MGEQPLPPHGSCLLAAINLSEYVLNPWTDDVRMDWKALTQDLETIYIEMNKVLDEGIPLHILPAQQRIATDWRNIGIGIMGLADVFIKFMTPYGSEKSKLLTKEIAEFIFRHSLYNNLALGQKEGTFPSWKQTVPYLNAKIIKHHFPKIKDKPTFRNSAMLTVAPTGSISNLFGCSGGIEPLFATHYYRNTKSLDGKDTTYTVLSGIVEEYLKLHPEDSIDNLPYYFTTAYDINYKDRIDIQSIYQNSIDSAISSTINLPKGTTIEEVKDLFIYAYQKGLKGITIYVEGSRDPILYTEPQTITLDSGVVKRPKSIKGEVHIVTADKIKYAVIVGILNDKPYEIFAFELAKNSNIIETQGVITKVKKNHYKFSNELFEIEDLVLATDKIEERSSTLFTSMLLRHNVGLEFVIKTAKKVNPAITSFTSAMCRVLNKYNKETGILKCPQCGEPIVKTGGCISCNHCGYALCNLLLTNKTQTNDN